MKKRRRLRMVVFDARIVAVAVMACAVLQFLLFVAGWITGEHALVYADDLRASPAPVVIEPKPVRLVFAPLPPPEPPPAVRPRPRMRRWPRPVPSAPDTYLELIRETALRHDVPAALVEAIVRVESDFDARALSPKGARGLMQVMPATARRFGVRNPEHLFDPRPNLAAGTAYLAWLLDRFDGDLDLALAAYNAGEGAVDNYRGIPPYPETREYVRRVRTVLAKNAV